MPTDAVSYEFFRKLACANQLVASAYGAEGEEGVYELALSLTRTDADPVVLEEVRRLRRGILPSEPLLARKGADEKPLGRQLIPRPQPATVDHAGHVRHSRRSRGLRGRARGRGEGTEAPHIATRGEPARVHVARLYARGSRSRTARADFEATVRRKKRPPHLGSGLLRLRCRSHVVRRNAKHAMHAAPLVDGADRRQAEPLAERERVAAK